MAASGALLKDPAGVYEGAEKMLGDLTTAY